MYYHRISIRQSMRREKVINSFLLIIYIFIATGCGKTLGNNYSNILDRRIKTPLTERYGTDILPNEEIVKKISEVILYERYINVDFEKFKPYKVNLIEDGKIWHFVAESHQSNVLFRKKYSILFNKNTGEVLSIWTVK